MVVVDGALEQFIASLPADLGKQVRAHAAARAIDDSEVRLFVDDIAARERRSERTVRHWWITGTLKSQKSGRRRYSTLAQLEAFIRDCTEGVKP